MLYGVIHSQHREINVELIQASSNSRTFHRRFPSEDMAALAVKATNTCSIMVRQPNPVFR